MFSRSKSKNRLVIRPSPEIHGERTKSGKTKSLSREFDILFSKISNIREWTKNLIRDSIAIVSTESDMDIKSYLNDSEKRHLGKTKLENLGTDMIKAAKSSGVKGGTYEKALLKVGECELRLGAYARDFVIDVCSSFIRPLKYFMDVELNKLLEEKEMLTSRKIDYDYHVRQGSNSRADKNTHHKLKMAEMALEFQYIHAKDILQGIEDSECQVGHLSDLVSVQSVYHQKCLAELEKLRDELKRMSSNVSAGRNDQKPVFDNSIKTSTAVSKKRADEAIPPEVLAKRPQNHPTTEDDKTPDSRIPLQEHFQNTNRTRLEKSLNESVEVHGEEAEGKRSVPEGLKGRSDQNERSEFQPKTAYALKSPPKVRSSILPSAESKRARLEKIPEDCKSRPIIELSQKCGKHRSKVYSAVKTGNKPSVSSSCHHYSGDHASQGGGHNKDDIKDEYTSDDSTTSKETHVIPIPVRSNYRRDVGKMFFTPCKDLE